MISATTDSAVSINISNTDVLTTSITVETIMLAKVTNYIKNFNLTSFSNCNAGYGYNISFNVTHDVYINVEFLGIKIELHIRQNVSNVIIASSLLLV